MKVNNMQKKAQIITFDFSTSLIVFLIFMALFIGLFLLGQSEEKKHEFELEYMFSNFENNLQYDLVAGRDFFRDYRINSGKLDAFASSVTNIDDYVVGNISSAHGIGLSSDVYDVCMYFIDNDGTRIDMNGKEAVGELQGGLTCDAEIIANRNPCDGYKQALSLFKPVLFDEGNPEDNRIVQMNLVVCKI
jgi:hypothetical protein